MKRLSKEHAHGRQLIYIEAVSFLRDYEPNPDCEFAQYEIAQRDIVIRQIEALHTKFLKSLSKVQL